MFLECRKVFSAQSFTRTKNEAVRTKCNRRDSEKMNTVVMTGINKINKLFSISVIDFVKCIQLLQQLTKFSSVLWKTPKLNSLNLKNSEVKHIRKLKRSSLIQRQLISGFLKHLFSFRNCCTSAFLNTPSFSSGFYPERSLIIQDQTIVNFHPFSKLTNRLDPRIRQASYIIILN